MPEREELQQWYEAQMLARGANGVDGAEEKAEKATEDNKKPNDVVKDMGKK